MGKLLRGKCPIHFFCLNSQANHRIAVAQVPSSRYQCGVQKVVEPAAIAEQTSVRPPQRPPLVKEPKTPRRLVARFLWRTLHQPTDKPRCAQSLLDQLRASWA
jgi:hypothetical protein